VCGARFPFSLFPFPFKFVTGDKRKEDENDPREKREFSCCLTCFLSLFRQSCSFSFSPPLCCFLFDFIRDGNRRPETKLIKL